MVVPPLHSNVVSQVLQVAESLSTFEKKFQMIDLAGILTLWYFQNVNNNNVKNVDEITRVPK